MGSTSEARNPPTTMDWLVQDKVAQAGPLEWSNRTPSRRVPHLGEPRTGGTESGRELNRLQRAPLASDSGRRRPSDPRNPGNKGWDRSGALRGRTPGRPRSSLRFCKGVACKPKSLRGLWLVVFGSRSDGRLAARTFDAVNSELSTLWFSTSVPSAAVRRSLRSKSASGNQLTRNRRRSQRHDPAET